MSIQQTAHAFFDACETGEGWAGCRAYCHDGATFSCQADALAAVATLEAYAEWMKGLLVPIADGRYELKAFAADAERGVVVAAAVFHGTHSADGGPMAPTGKTVAADYAYVIMFEGEKIRHVTKIWNDVTSLRALGWA